MEDASKAIWLAVGAILFIAGLTTAIIMYTNMIRTVNTTLSINDNKTNVVEQSGDASEIIYTDAERYFLFKGLNENATKVCASSCTITSTTGDCKIKYAYQYDPAPKINDLNNHKLSTVSAYH